MEYIEDETKEFTTNRGHKFVFKCLYPKENPEFAFEDIYTCLLYLGVFDEIE